MGNGGATIQTNTPPPSLDLRSDEYWQRFASQNERSGDAANKIHLDQLPSPLDAAKRKSLPAWIR